MIISISNHSAKSKTSIETEFFEKRKMSRTLSINSMYSHLQSISMISGSSVYYKMRMLSLAFYILFLHDMLEIF